MITFNSLRPLEKEEPYCFALVCWSVCRSEDLVFSAQYILDPMFRQLPDLIHMFQSQTASICTNVSTQYVFTPLLGLIEWIVFFAVSAIFHAYNGGPLLGSLEVVPLLGSCRT